MIVVSVVHSGVKPYTGQTCTVIWGVTRNRLAFDLDHPEKPELLSILL